MLLLKYEMGLTYEGIGVLLGINTANVKTYLYRARNAFRKEWENCGGEKMEGN